MACCLAVMLVEDEALIRMALADMIVDLGHNVVAEAANIEDSTSFAMTVNCPLIEARRAPRFESLPRTGMWVVRPFRPHDDLVTFGPVF
ncbi:hypothetical protein [Bradyrhizobium sp. U531]|uniref:hypothetical protein n=1 Tax=Bradyrhizobium sp. U531 TaxID=3053458 RepID=UPI003F686722